ncbi:hypothetical protein ACWEQL_34310 [Kitasatospora sp. NPDC004240]
MGKVLVRLAVAFAAVTTLCAAVLLPAAIGPWYDVPWAERAEVQDDRALVAMAETTNPGGREEFQHLYLVVEADRTAADPVAAELRRLERLGWTVHRVSDRPAESAVSPSGKSLVTVTPAGEFLREENAGTTATVHQELRASLTADPTRLVLELVRIRP